jgi:hypothetical protein
MFCDTKNRRGSVISCSKATKRGNARVPNCRGSPELAFTRALKVREVVLIERTPCLLLFGGEALTIGSCARRSCESQSRHWRNGTLANCGVGNRSTSSSNALAQITYGATSEAKQRVLFLHIATAHLDSEH